MEENKRVDHPTWLAPRSSFNILHSPSLLNPRAHLTHTRSPSTYSHTLSALPHPSHRSSNGWTPPSSSPPKAEDPHRQPPLRNRAKHGRMVSPALHPYTHHSVLQEAEGGRGGGTRVNMRANRFSPALSAATKRET